MSIADILQPVDARSDAEPAPFVGLPTSFTSSPYAGLYSALMSSDEAFRQDPSLADMMRRDPIVASSMQLRESMIAGLEWAIEPVDPTDAQQVAQASAIQSAIQAIPDLLGAIQHLARFAWYGTSPVSLVYAPLSQAIEVDEAVTDDEGNITEASATVRFSPVSWMPIHGDSVRFTRDGRLAVRVALQLTDFQDAERVFGPDGTVVVLSPEQRSSVVAPVWGRTAPTYNDPATADRPYRGEGLRSLAWDAWYRLSVLKQLSTHYAERLARGTTLIKHTPGAEGKRAAQALADGMAGSFVNLVPDGALGDGSLEDLVRIVEPTGTGHQIFSELIATAEAQIREVLVIASLTTQSGATGLGSSLAEEHADRLADVADLDALLFAGALTRDLVRVIHRTNFADTGTPAPAWVFPEVENRRRGRGDAQNRSALADAIKAAAIVPVGESHIRKLAGVPQPKPGEAIADAAGDGGVDDLVASLKDRLGAP